MKKSKYWTKEMYKVPKKVSYKGVVYDVDTSADNILEIQKYMLDENMTGYDRAIMIITKMFGVYAPVEQPLIDEALLIINLGKEPQENVGTVDFDYFHDYSSVRMDIIREYGVDIQTVKVGWDWLVYAIENLSEKSITNQKRMYRSIDTRKIKDKEQRKEYEKLKKLVALPSIEKEEEKSDLQIIYEEFKNKQKGG